MARSSTNLQPVSDWPELHVVAGNEDARAAAGLAARSILQASGHRVGAISSRGWSDGRKDYPLDSGVSDRSGIRTLLSVIAERGCSKAIIEVGPAVLADRVLEELTIESLIVLPLSLPGDEGGLETEAARSERASIARLARQLRVNGPVVVFDEDLDSSLIGASALQSRRVGLSERRAETDFVWAVRGIDRTGSRIELHSGAGRLDLSLAWLTREQIAGAVAAAALGLVVGIEPIGVVSSLARLGPMAGHLEPMGTAAPSVWIDDALDPQRLANALATLRRVTAGRLRMVLVARRGWSDMSAKGIAEACEMDVHDVVLTAETPDDPESIERVRRWFRRPGRVRVEPEPARAIEAALEIHDEDDALLLAVPGESGATPPWGRGTACRPTRLLVGELATSRWGSWAGCSA